MNIDILVAKLVKKGMTETKAKNFASKIVEISKSYGISVYQLLDETANISTFNEIGDFLTNSVYSKGYRTGKIKRKKSSDIVTRTIIK